MKKEENDNKEYRAHQIRIKKGHKMYSYFEDTSLNANNLYNTTNFYIRQIYTALTQNKLLQPLQKEVLDIIDKNIDKMNDSQLAAYRKKLEKEKSKPLSERKEIKAKLFSKPSKEKPYVSYEFLDCLFKIIKQKDYLSLPGQVNQQVMKICFQDWKSFFKSLKDFKNHPEKYKARPNIPGYQTKGSFKEAVFSNQICKIKNDKYLTFPLTRNKLNIGKLGFSEGNFQQVRVVPSYDGFVVELIFLVGEEREFKAKKERCLSIDLGINRLATVVTNTGIAPILFVGTYIKSINQYYNKMRSYYYAILRNGKQSDEGNFVSKRLLNFDKKRYLRMKDFFHKLSFNIIQIALKENIDTIIIGKNDAWKQNANMGNINNQNFVNIPYSLLIQMIKYKASQQGIAVIVSEESYTSKASFLDNDMIPTYVAGNQEKYTFSGKRYKGSYKTNSGKFLNADVNGSANILRKVVPDAFKLKGVVAVCSQPLVVNIR
jgi:putative transposase